MHPFLILAIGMAIVIGGILFLRLHAFLALILAALAVAAMTSPDAVEQFYLEKNIAALEDLNLEGEQLASAKETAALQAQQLSKKLFVFRVAQGFGGGAAKIGILIAMAAIIGKCLLDSGAAERIVVWIRKVFGEKRTPVAFSVSSFTLAIPVFFDTVFYLLMPLGKAMRRRTGKDYLLYILAIVAGGTMAHSLVPPTPGPIFVAEEMGVDIGVMMLAGLVVGVFTVSSGYTYAVWANKRWELPLRTFDDMPEEDAEKFEGHEAQLPPLLLSLAPILLPVLLISGQTIAKEVYETDIKALRILGDKNIALIISAAISLAMLAWSKRKSFKEMSAPVQDALASGGVIILITSAGSAFGASLHQTGVAKELQGVMPDTQLLLLVMAFGITTLVRTAQGSATVAMMTAVGIVGPLVQGVELAFHPVYVALAIGCGSKPVSWMNDSGFWIIGRLTGMTEVETLRTVTVMLIVMGLTGLAVILLGATFVPLTG